MGAERAWWEGWEGEDGFFQGCPVCLAAGAVQHGAPGGRVRGPLSKKDTRGCFTSSTSRAERVSPIQGGEVARGAGGCGCPRPPPLPPPPPSQ